MRQGAKYGNPRIGKNNINTAVHQQCFFNHRLHRQKIRHICSQVKSVRPTALRHVRQRFFVTIHEHRCATLGYNFQGSCSPYAGGCTGDQNDTG